MILKWIKDLFKKLKELKFIPYIPKDLDLKYFKLSEFDSPDEVGSGKKMDSKFLEKLDYARHNSQIPFKINSGYRTQEWNMKVGGRFGSSHKKGLAADIGYTGSRERYLILSALMQVGINRFGIAKGFIHCDVDKAKDPDVIWLY
jgi:uncharacterized protein YcbK (DUF882 family)|tara:strand:+ start:54 stop:488 length:435 start_codon:yes stop_codon:yes gene_type:complete